MRARISASRSPLQSLRLAIFASIFWVALPALAFFRPNLSGDDVRAIPDFDAGFPVVVFFAAVVFFTDFFAVFFAVFLVSFLAIIYSESVVARS
jgi:hypothetical protein